jgi:acyl transferase domain-containing protein
MPFVVSAKSLQALRQYLISYLEFCRKALPSEFQNICYTSCVGREHYRYRFGCVASNFGDLIQNLEEELRSLSLKRDDNTAGRILFAFPGQGSQYQGMASELANRYPEFKDILAFTSAAAANLSGHRILSFLMDTTGTTDLEVDDGRLAQICIFVYQYSISLWLRTLGIEPSAVLGHSLGEIAAAGMYFFSPSTFSDYPAHFIIVIAGGLTYELGLELVIKRSEILRSDPAHPGGMAIVATSKNTITELLRQLGLEGRLVIAVYNSSQSHVVSGELVALDAFLSMAKTKGLRVGKLKVAQGEYILLTS